MAEATRPNHRDDRHSAAQTLGSRTALDLHTCTAQISAVAPWLDIPNAYQRYRIRTHRRKHVSDYPPKLLPATGDARPLPNLGVMQPTAMGVLPRGRIGLVRL